MKQYIKDGIVYNAPVRVEVGNNAIYTNDEQELKKYGYIEYVYEAPQKSLEQLIKESDEEINKETDEKILNDFKYNGNEFYLTTENQANFANLFIAKEFLTYPQQVKTKTGFMQIDNVSEVSGFYLAGVNFIKQCLETGWKKKAFAAEQITLEYSK